MAEKDQNGDQKELEKGSSTSKQTTQSSTVSKEADHTAITSSQYDKLENQYENQYIKMMMEKGVLQCDAQNHALWIMSYYQIRVTLKAFIERRYWDGDNAKTTKDLRKKLRAQLRKGSICALEMGRDALKDAQQSENNCDNDNDDDNCSV